MANIEGKKMEQEFHCAGSVCHPSCSTPMIDANIMQLEVALQLSSLIFFNHLYSCLELQVAPSLSGTMVKHVKHCGIPQNSSLGNNGGKNHWRSLKKQPKVPESENTASLASRRVMLCPALLAECTKRHLFVPHLLVWTLAATHVTYLSLSLSPAPSMPGWRSLPWALQRQGHSKALRIHWGQHGSSTPCEWIQRCPGLWRSTPPFHHNIQHENQQL